MANNVYAFTALTGGETGALDAIPGAILATGDLAFGVSDGNLYAYKFNAASSATEASPDVIAPDSGSGRWILALGSGASGTSVVKAITQNSHGFAVGDVLKFAGGVYAKAQADSAANAEVVGIVSAVTENTFDLLNVGFISGLSSLTAGTVYFLSPSSAGALADTEPTTVNQVSKPLLIAVSTTEGYFCNFRGSVVLTSADAVSDAGYGSGWDDVTDVAPSKNAVYDEMELRAPKANPTFTGLITTAGQIKFPATQNASSNANTLDDYEEGTWTPSFAVKDLEWSTAPTSITAKYTKIGRVVFISLIGCGGTCQKYDAIGGLPFTATGPENMTVYNISTAAIVGYGSTSSSTIAVLSAMDFSAGSYWFVLSGFYTAS